MKVVGYLYQQMKEKIGLVCKQRYKPHLFGPLFLLVFLVHFFNSRIGQSFGRKVHRYEGRRLTVSANEREDLVP